MTTMKPDQLLLDRIRLVLRSQRARMREDPTLAARLRRDPVALARLLAEVPPDLLGQGRDVWADAVRVLAKVAQSQRPAGAALYDTDMSEARLGRMLRGGFAVREGGRWLAAKEAEHADVAQLVALDLCRAVANHEALHEIADQVALDYARAAVRRRRQGTKQLAAT
jgi:hypothetical protein